ncbi:MAG: hypothetical protein J6S54_13200 [Lentisphaeria bacterium]|nr:hypothetical protein [Lentisphaeria bacterium]
MTAILIPRNEGIFSIAAAELVSFLKRITGKEIPVLTEDDGKSDLLVLGSDAVNDFSHRMIIEKVIPGFKLRTGSDDYHLLSAQWGRRKLLFIAGARPRALLYGVYYYLETFGDCRYFWDGDRVPRKKSLEMSGIDISESPRFEYRGLRYFAHRSLNRFQAEHWDFEEWKKEIDWILKKRLNTFMLRMGLDDLFQQTFPEFVKYPSWQVPESKPRSYDDRDLFWSLEYRGELRRKILNYARERDLIHPEDVGTMTHWYSRTPYDFLNHVKPEFIPQATTAYNQETGLVWDIRKDENLENYFKLTRKSIELHGKPALFHTIGLAERRCYNDRQSNHEMKLYTYRRIISKLREEYPETPLMIGTWDFCMYWSCSEVQALVRELDPANTIIFDYTSDTSDEVNNFTNWGVVNKFPWMFGIFHAYESANGIRGNYDIIARRLPIAADDPMCKGFFFWPENSHADTLMLEFFAAKAWDPSECTLEAFLPEFCAKRYGEKSEEMLEVWRLASDAVKNIGWCGPGDPVKRPGSSHNVLSTLIYGTGYIASDPVMLGIHSSQVKHMSDAVKKLPQLCRALAAQTSGAGEFIYRDIVDLALMAIGRIESYGFSKLFLAMESWRNGQTAGKEVIALLKQMRSAAELEHKIVSSHEDYSMFHSLKLLQQKHETNPDFEKTLKANGENSYCRAVIAEFFPALYLPQLEFYEGWVTDKIRSGDRSPWEYPSCFTDAIKEFQEYFYNEDLETFAPDIPGARKGLKRNLMRLADTIEKIITNGTGK